MNRRKFLSVTAIASVLPSVYTRGSNHDLTGSMNEKKTKGKITFGVIANVENPEADIKQVREFGFDHFQASVKEFTPEMAQEIVAACKKICCFTCCPDLHGTRTI